MQTVNANGAAIPAIGLGTWPMQGATCRDAVSAALDAGYRHIDTAALYGNEADVGAAIRASGIGRDEVFVTTKIALADVADGDLQRAAAAGIDRLGIGPADLLLIHWPGKRVAVAEMVGALNDVRRAGLTRNIGVSNFNESQLRAAVAASEAPLAALQIEYHPSLNQDRMLGVAREFGLAVTAYCPIGRTEVFIDPVVVGIAERHGKTPVQVVLRWHVQQNVAAIPKSQTPARIIENIQVFDFALTEDEIAAISGLAKPDGRIVNMADWQPDWDS